MNTVTNQFRAMGCPCELRLFIPDKLNQEKVVSCCVAEALRFEEKYSRYRSSSLVSRINAAAGVKAIDIDPETSAILDYTRVCFEQSDGLFDITAGSLRSVWHQNMKTLPSQEVIERGLTKIGFDKLILSADSIFLPFTGMELDFGGVVKEYAADAIATLAKSMGIQHGLVNLGGDVCVIGAQQDGTAWPIGVIDPFGHGEAIARIELSEGALTTSGSYERFFQVEGKTYSHLINPLTGWPVEGLVSASVIAEQTIVAGSISSIALLADTAGGLAWLQSCQAPYLAIDQNKVCHGTLK